MVSFILRVAWFGLALVWFFVIWGLFIVLLNGVGDIWGEWML